MEYTSEALTITTDHPNSHYGIPVVLFDGVEVAATDLQSPEVVALFGPTSTYGELARMIIGSDSEPEEVKRDLRLWLSQWPDDELAVV